MPLPPIHAFASLIFYFRSKATVDPLALVASATFVDLEPLYYVLVGQPLDHQIWHGFALTLTVYPLLVGLLVYSAEHLFERSLWTAYNALRLNPAKAKYPALTVYVSCLAGGLSHLFFDMFTHESLPYIIYPMQIGNPFYLGSASGIIEVIAIALAATSVFLWVRKTH